MAMDDRMMEMGMGRPFGQPVYQRPVYGQPVYGQPGFRQQPARYGGAAVVPPNAYARPAAPSMNAFANAVAPSGAAQPMGLAAAANAMESSVSHRKFVVVFSNPVGVGYRYSFKGKMIDTNVVPSVKHNQVVVCLEQKEDWIRTASGWLPLRHPKYGQLLRAVAERTVPVVSV